MPLQLPKVNAKLVEGKSSQDLTAHPWAGLKVRMISSWMPRNSSYQSGVTS